MRKVELHDLVLDWLAGGDAPSDIKGRYHRKIIETHINIAYSRIVMDTYMEAKTYSDYSTLDAWAKNYTITITSLVTPKGNVLLPYPPVQLPNNMGILQVAPSSDLANAFAYRETNSNAIFAALEITAISTRPTFYMEQNTGSEVNSHVLRLDKIPTGCSEVFVKLIVPLERMGEYDEIAIPAGKEDRIIAYVSELLSEKSKEDVINDNKVN